MFQYYVFEYVLKYQKSSEVGKDVEGVGFHCYRGDWKSPGTLASEFPNKKMMFTECSGFGEDADEWGPTVLKWNQEEIFIGQPVYGQSTNGLLWNIALDESHGPNQVEINLYSLSLCLY